MHKFSALIVAGLLTSTTGCRSTDYNARVFHPWGWENAKDAKTHLDRYKHVLLVRIYEDHWEDRGLHSYSLYHCKATVVRTYKGEWRTSEGISFVEWLDYPVPATWTSNADKLVFVFTNEHMGAEIAIAAGEVGTYNAEYARALDRVFSGTSSR